MFSTLKTLFSGANARAEEQLRDTYSIELIDQKIREAEGNLRAAKMTLASLIQRQRTEIRQVEILEGRATDLLSRAKEALEGEREDLAQSAAAAVAEMENELTLRRQTVDRLEARVLQLRQSVETANRRIVDLKQGAVMARATRREQDLQRRLNQNLGQSPMEEAEGLISRVLNQDDPFEKGQILQEIDRGLNHSNTAQELADAGFGAPSRSTAADVLSRLKQVS
ncbi:PspA/IM30 family protein [Roseobacter sp. SK209-2-6]|uniref:PspA/IM30 family protein n=1 Tax=Roseobacter sp. SK209-2-6 TaxID=388739 RepID=UPI0002DA8D7E|nr:PspA/IM30 family protein [Roseobacter sp. SK209-2-6]